MGKAEQHQPLAEIAEMRAQQIRNQRVFIRQCDNCGVSASALWRDFHSRCPAALAFKTEPPGSATLQPNWTLAEGAHDA
jgi:hypothetical protein